MFGLGDLDCKFTVSAKLLMDHFTRIKKVVGKKSVSASHQQIEGKMWRSVLNLKV